MTISEFRDAIDLARAHSVAIRSIKGRQAHVTVRFYKRDAKVYLLDVCLGACPKCDRIWINVRRGLAGIKMVQVDPPKPPAPPQAEVLADDS